MGRHIEITTEIKDAVIGAAEADPEISLRDICDIYIWQINNVSTVCFEQRPHKIFSKDSGSTFNPKPQAK